MSENDLQEQQRKYQPQALRKPASAISDSATFFCTGSYSRQPTNTSYTFSVTIVSQYAPNVDYDLEVSGYLTNEKKTRSSVKGEVSESDGAEKFIVSYRRYLDQETNCWNVYDPVSEGVSILRSFKSASAEDYKRNGIEYMIAQMEGEKAEPAEGAK